MTRGLGQHPELKVVEWGAEVGVEDIEAIEVVVEVIVEVGDVVEEHNEGGELEEEDGIVGRDGAMENMVGSWD